MTVQEVAKELGITERAVRYWIAKGTQLGPYFEKRDGIQFVYKKDFNKFSRFYKGAK